MRERSGGILKSMCCELGMVVVSKFLGWVHVIDSLSEQVDHFNRKRVFDIKQAAALRGG